MWPELLSPYRPSELIPLPERLADVAHDLHHAVEDFLGINRPNYEKRRTLDNKREDYRKRLQKVDLSGLAYRGYDAEILADAKEIEALKLELENEEWPRAVVSEGGAEAQAHFFLSTQAIEMEKKGSQRLSLAFRYIAQRRRWKMEYQNGAEEKNCVYPVGATLAEMVRRWGRKESDFTDIFYREKRSGFKGFDFNRLAEMLKHEVRRTALRVQAG